tara:strand:- start:669 stop:923 length:255 start_codon:yes stop_codon:yes gene_type:complete
MPKVKKPSRIWLAVLVISIIAFIASLTTFSNQIHQSPALDQVIKTPSPVTQTTLAITYVSYIAFIASGVMVSYQLKNQRPKKRK